MECEVSENTKELLGQCTCTDKGGRFSMKWMDENDPDSCRCRAICMRPRDMKYENPFASTQFGICYNDKRRGCERRGRMGDDTATTTTEKSGCSATISNLWICVGAVLMMVGNI